MNVFVYGTVTDPERVAERLERDRSDCAGPVTLEGLRRVDGAYPTLAPGGSVDGRVLAVDGRALERLDRYEGVDSGLYVRVPVPFADREGRAHVYVGDPDRLGVAEAIEWPGDGPFADRVRRGLEADDVVVRTRE